MDRAVQWVQRFFHTCLSANVLKFQVDFYFQPNFFQLHNVICSTDIFDMEDVWLPMNSDDINKDTKFLNWLSSPSSKLFYSIKKRSFLHFWLDGVESSSVETVAFSISIFFQFDFLRFVRFRCGHLFGHLSFVTFLLLKYEVSLSIETKWILPPPFISDRPQLRICSPPVHQSRLENDGTTLEPTPNEAKKIRARSFFIGRHQRRYCGSWDCADTVSSLSAKSLPVWRK